MVFRSETSGVASGRGERGVGGASRSPSLCDREKYAVELRDHIRTAIDNGRAAVVVGAWRQQLAKVEVRSAAR
jgi:hypothetical protein